MKTFSRLIYCCLLILTISFGYADKVEDLLLDGASLESEQKYEEALKLYEKALTIAPNHAPVYSSLADAYVGLEQYDKAIENLEKARILNPNYFRYDFVLGKTYIKINKWEEAIKAFKLVLEKRGEYGEAYFFLGLSLAESGKDEEAIEVYKDAIKHMSWNPYPATVNMGMSYIRLSRWDEAIEAFKSLIQTQDEKVWNWLALVYAMAKRNNEAIKTCQEAIAKLPKPYIFHYNLGVLYLMEGRKEEALDEYNTLKGSSEEWAKKLDEVISGKAVPIEDQLIYVPFEYQGKTELGIIHPEPKGKKYTPLVG